MNAKDHELYFQIIPRFLTMLGVWVIAVAAWGGLFWLVNSSAYFKDGTFGVSTVVRQIGDGQ